MRQKIASITQRFRIPAVCLLCGSYHRGCYAVCRTCEGLLTRIDHPCRYCGLPLIDESFAVCGHCVKQRPAFDKVLTAYRFEGALRTLLHDYKYGQTLAIRTFLAKLMLDALPRQPYKPDCLIPVPLHLKRLRQRGFNQAVELAKLLAGQLNIPCYRTLCRKTINTPAQVGLSSQQRRKNLRHSFTIGPHNFQHVTLVDDLLTTGSTASELARQFKKQGVRRVDVWCCARTAERSCYPR
ncbi:ComF family protein [Legionella spiritensis]|uniref:Competence protein ComF n=1 Tax=Legionella spiritensis TaxID=452 RepID=A0A0W0ZAG0_LEGSP|nr:ComF family protein [Legionella spiritensis]KTD66108.1 competence protein ComF [Legionella spiritensis]SNV44134.1 competence protein ComF [Legionella spiritensis]